MISVFKKPKYESQYITEIKETKQSLEESVWDFDQRFKTLMEKGQGIARRLMVYNMQKGWTHQG